MISVNDTSILAMFCRYPDISNSEAEEHMSLLEHEENRGVCEALLGQRLVTSLNPDQQRTYQEVIRWSNDRTQRTRNEQVVLRRRGKNNRLRDKMINLYERGIVSNEIMMLYAISGPLPDVLEYRKMRAEQKEEFWSNRIEQNLGDVPQTRLNWREFQNKLREWFQFEDRKVNWMKEGF